MSDASGERVSAADDYGDIAKRAKFIKAMENRECAMKSGGRSIDCWCFKAGPNGSHLPCPGLADGDLREVACGD